MASLSQKINWGNRKVIGAQKEVVEVYGKRNKIVGEQYCTGQTRAVRDDDPVIGSCKGKQ